MKEASLIYNPNAGGATLLSAETICEELSKVGYDVTHIATSSEKDLDKVLNKIEGLVFVAGGDGSIRGVAIRAIQHPNLRIAPIPMGTANNIGNALGITGETHAVIAGYEHTFESTYDVGHIKAPWGEEYFLEGMGGGLYADTLATYDPDNGKSVLRAISAMKNTLPHYKPYDIDLQIDDKSISGSFIMFEILNTSAAGPRLPLAPDAKASDGLFEVVLVHENNRLNFTTYVAKLVKGELAVLDNVENFQAKKVVLSWHGYPVHVDGLVRTDTVKVMHDGQAISEESTKAAKLRPEITIEVVPSALKLLIPKIWTPLLKYLR